MTDLAASNTVNKTIIGFARDPCARCPDLVATWIKERLPQFRYESYPIVDLEKIVAAKIQAKEEFVSTWWAPSAYSGQFPEMQKLNMEEYTADLFNQGKALIRKYQPGEKIPLSQTALNAYTSVFLGTSVISELAYKASQLKSDNAPYEIAMQWIKDNQKTFDMFSW